MEHNKTLLYLKVFHSIRNIKDIILKYQKYWSKKYAASRGDLQLLCINKVYLPGFVLRRVLGVAMTQRFVLNISKHPKKFLSMCVCTLAVCQLFYFLCLYVMILRCITSQSVFNPAIRTNNQQTLVLPLRPSRRYVRYVKLTPSNRIIFQKQHASVIITKAGNSQWVFC